MYTVEVPLPPAECSSNQHGQSRRAGFKRSAAVKLYRADCGVLYAQAAKKGNWPVPFPKAVLHLDFYQARIAGNRTKCISLDVSNAIASFKAGQDALADAGVIVSDSHKYLDVGKTRLFNTAKEHGGRRCVLVSLEVQDPEEAVPAAPELLPTKAKVARKKVTGVEV